MSETGNVIPGVDFSPASSCSSLSVGSTHRGMGED